MAMISCNCPNCGANIELDDSREFGFCNFCGTKVMQDKIVVEHKGSVKVDNTEFVQKYLMNARRARQKGDWAEVEKYYNLVEQNDPENIEAIFYSAYGKLRCTLLEYNSAKWTNDFGVLEKSVSVLDDYFDISNEAEQRKVITDAVKDILKLTDVISNHIAVGQNPSNNVFNEFSELGIKKRIINIFPQLNETLDNIISKYKANGLDPSYLNELKSEINGNSKKSGCYVATAVYGSYDCPQVWTLRRYRDNQLAKSWYGRMFIKTYYAVSPTLVKWFGNTDWFKNMWKPILDEKVLALQENGVESTPYEDKNW